MNKITQILINTALAVLKRLVLDKIQYPPVQVFTTTTFGNLKEVAAIVTDNDPENGAQLKAYFDQNKLKLASTAVSTLKAVVDAEFKNEEVKEIVGDLLQQIEDALAA